MSACRTPFGCPRCGLLAGVYIVIQIGVYIVNLWMPLILSQVGDSGAANAALIARYATVPYLLAAIFTVVLGRTSDRWNERRRHLAGCMALAAVGCVWAARAGSIVARVVRAVPVGDWLVEHDGAVLGADDAMVSGSAATGAVAIITTIGGLGGFLGPTLTGLARDATHSFAGGLVALGVLCCGGGGAGNVRAARGEFVTLPPGLKPPDFVGLHVRAEARTLPSSGWKLHRSVAHQANSRSFGYASG